MKSFEPKLTLLKKSRIVMNMMFSVFGLIFIMRYCCDIMCHNIMGRFPPTLTFQSALLHISIPNTSNLSTPVIGSCLLVYASRNNCRILDNNVLHFWTVFGPISLLYKALSARNLGIPAELFAQYTRLVITCFRCIAQLQLDELFQIKLN